MIEILIQNKMISILYILECVCMFVFMYGLVDNSFNMFIQSEHYKKRNWTFYILNHSH